MVMPSSQDTFSVVGHDPQDSRKLPRIEAVALYKSHFGLYPNLGIASAALHVNMWWLARRPFVREEVVAQATFAEDNGHIAAPRPAPMSSRTPRRAPARVALQARSVPHQREVQALRAHLAFV